MFGDVRSFDEIRKDLADAIALVEKELGKKLNSECRAMQYLRDVDEIARTWQADGGHAAIERHGARRLVNSLMEADVLGFVNKLLAPRLGSDRQLLKKIEQCLYGPLHADEEKGGGAIQARNFFFELRLLGQLTNANLAAISGEHPDIRTEVKGYPILIECKRASSRPNLRTLASKGREQLNRQLEQDRSAFGIIAFDFTKIMPADRWYGIHEDQREFRSWLKATREIVVASFDPDIGGALRQRAHHRVLGMIQYFQAPTYIRSTGQWGAGWSQDFVAFKGRDPNEIVEEFSRIMDRANG